MLTLGSVRAEHGRVNHSWWMGVVGHSCGGGRDGIGGW